MMVWCLYAPWVASSFSFNIVVVVGVEASFCLPAKAVDAQMRIIKACEIKYFLSCHNVAVPLLHVFVSAIK